MESVVNVLTHFHSILISESNTLSPGAFGYYIIKGVRIKIKFTCLKTVDVTWDF